MCCGSVRLIVVVELRSFIVRLEELLRDRYALLNSVEKTSCVCANSYTNMKPTPVCLILCFS